MSLGTGRAIALEARWFHALADETRLGILDRLRDGEQCVCDLTDALATGQSRLSFHVKALKDAGLVTDRREGRWVYYSLDLDALGDLAAMLTEVQARGAECCTDGGCCP